MTDVDKLTAGMIGIRGGVGLLALAAPSLGLRLFGFPSAHDTPTTRTMGRLFGIRNLLLAGQLAANRGKPTLGHVAAWNAVVDTSDALVLAVPLARRQGIDRGAATALATACVAAAGFLSLSRAAGEQP